MEWTPLIVILTVAYFLVASITTYDTRIIQGKRYGLLPLYTPLLPTWVGVFGWLQWGIFLVLLYLNWKYALALFILKFVLKVLPVLETIGRILMSPFKPQVKTLDEMNKDFEKATGLPIKLTDEDVTLRFKDQDYSTK